VSFLRTTTWKWALGCGVVGIAAAIVACEILVAILRPGVAGATLIGLISGATGYLGGFSIGSEIGLRREFPGR
jgi:hypothetical protein